MWKYGVGLVLVSCAAAWGGEMVITKEALDAAPEAKVEKFGVVQTMGRICGHGFSPGTKERPPRQIISFWSMADRKFFATFVVDLPTGEVRKISEPGFDQDAPRWPSVVGKDGKMFFSCMRGALAIYEPERDTFKMVRPIARATWLRGLAIGPDGGVYVSDYPSGSAARYDPVTGTIEEYGPQGGPFNITNIYGYSVGSDGEWVYTAVGKIPWYVVACNRKTKEQKKLFQFDQADFPGILQRGDEVYLSAHIVDQAKNTSRAEYYRLAGGTATRIEKLPDKPPATPPELPQPEVEMPSRGLDMEPGGAVLWYRMPEARVAAEKSGKQEGTREELGWRKVLLPIPGEPWKVQRIAPMGDGRIVFATGIYGDVFIFDPAQGKYERVGNPANRNVYCLLVVGGKIYFGGYSNAIIGTFDDGRGKILYDYNRIVGSKHSYHLALGADGRIYLGNQAEREFVGGSLAWWDPKVPDGNPGGIRFANDENVWLTTALDGRFMVYSSRAVSDPAHPEVKATDGRLIVYDTREQKIVQQFTPLPGEEKNGTAGMIIEATPGVVLGLSRFQGKPVMYAAEVLTGKVLHVAPLPVAAAGDLQRGPDGMLYTFLGETLVRIEPKTLAITPVCRAAPGRMAFSGADLYLSGEPELRCIRAVAK